MNSLICSCSKKLTEYVDTLHHHGNSCLTRNYKDKNRKNLQL